jgi:IS30 family transposase
VSGGCRITPRIAAQLNGRPRKTLAWMNPAEKLHELLTTA